MIVQILIDNKNSWAVPYGEKLCKKVSEKGIDCKLHFEHSEIISGDILFLFSCEKLFKNLGLNKHNLVVHESDLPKGKGWSPLTWQILEGKNKIPVTLFEAAEKVDAGDIYIKKYIELDGTELIDETKHLQGEATIEIIMEFIEKYPNIKGVPQEGVETFYPKRTPVNSKLDITKSIEEQFNLFRVCDNERYPAYFEINGRKYNVKIYKDE
jgi:methionyl-tRNA formyltransferase